MHNLWGQSHPIQALGARLVDAAKEVDALKGVERTLTVTADGESITISSNHEGTL